MTAEHKNVRRSHKLLDALVRNAPQQGHPLAQARVGGDSLLDRAQQWCHTEATEQLQPWQRWHRSADAIQDSQRVLVRVEVPDPQDSRLPPNVGQMARLFPVTGCKAACGFRDFVDARVSVHESGARKRLRLLAGTKRDSAGN